MPKISWAAADEDDLLTAEDIDEAEEGFKPYAGEIPTGGVYRFKWRRAKYKEFGSGNQGLEVLLLLDGSWKPTHRKFDGCPLWDRVVMTKGAAGFVKAFAAALGVSSSDMTSRVVVDEDGIVTKIGKRTIDEDIELYVAVKRGSYNDEPRLEIAGTGYVVLETDDDEPDDDGDDEAAPPPKKSTAKAAATKGKATAGAKGRNRATADDDEPPF